MIKMKISLFALCLILSISLAAQSGLIEPTIEQSSSLRGPSNPHISPDGADVVFQVRSVEWETNRFDTEIWISKNGDQAFPLTNNPSSSSYDPKWSPDGKWIAFLSYRSEGTQIYVIRADGGESFAAVKVDGDISSYDWSPDGTKFAFTMDQQEAVDRKSLRDEFGNFEVEDEEWVHSWLYLIDFRPSLVDQSIRPCHGEQDMNCLKWPKPVALIDSVDFTINAFKWSPDGTQIAFDKQPNSLVNTYLSSDIGILDVASKRWKTLVNHRGPDFVFDWSPDSKSIVYYTTLNDLNTSYYSNGHYFTIDVNSGIRNELARGFDEELKDLKWSSDGIYAVAYQRTKAQLFKINPIDGSIEVVSEAPDRVYEFSIDADGSMVALIGENDRSLREVFRTSLISYAPQQISDFSDQIANWKVGTSEVIRWESKDGTSIEGILHKPDDYDPSKKYPLLVVIHGGPTMTDRPTPVPVFCPVVQWLNKGALVLRPNYRGSGGYGEKFRSLNVGNLGIGDAWDILSGIDHLDELNLIDTSQMGCMGWSQGGYIAAFLATTTNRFKAVSVGAGISNWKTDYATTDLHPFTIQYLGDTPWNDPELYEKTSPITYIKQAATPTLIQHCKNDQRAPIANAYELLQGLRDMDVETKLIIYDTPGHSLYKPKERYAGSWHNWQWFGKHIFNEEIKVGE